ncbi:MAG: aspartate carbamoyltransferase regulatory subunit [Sulfolobales archaeon]
MNSHTLTVSKIGRGTVIDHIPAGRGVDVLKVLRITGREGYRIAILMNVESSKYGKKDIVKIENRFLTPEEVNIISLVAPTATINIIENYEVKNKFRVEIPEEIRGVLKCPNPTCITNQSREPISTFFKRRSLKPLKIECVYCGTLIEESEIPRLLGI